MKHPVIVPRLGQSSVDASLTLGLTADLCPILCFQGEDSAPAHGGDHHGVGDE